MRHKKALKWIASVMLLTLAMAAIIPGTGAAPPAQEPNSVACGDSITCSTPGNAVYVKNTATGPAIYGHNTANGDGLKGRGNPGVYGFSYHAAGIRGKSNQGVGVKGESVDKYGVQGIASGTSGQTYGVYGSSVSPNHGIGVGGYATAASGYNYGVWGESLSTDGCGVVGKANATSGTTCGVHGQTASPDGTAVYGENTAASGSTHGVAGVVSSPQGVGGYFENTQGGSAIHLVGDAAQSLESSGLVKAAVAGYCFWMGPGVCTIERSFDNVGGTITLTPGASGEFTVDLGFDVSERFWAATMVRYPGYSIVCELGSTDTQLDCEVQGSSNFAFMLLIY